ncbi:Metallophos-domain-containing protein [Peniophora sp. CONT]|nr:Metallophos-domain-containing protein [Peniophora sp. CONT]
MKIAVEGCCHGELPAIYKHIKQLEGQRNVKVDLLLVCGDFQALRNRSDLECMAVPDKFKALGDFHRYYTGELEAPIPTIVIGGNHEASNYMWELYHGGWLAPNIYFLGHAGCIQVNGIRIAGVSGIFKSGDFNIGHPERLPYNRSTMRSIYHARKYDIIRVSLLTSPHIFLSHDWPAGIEHHGDFNRLMRRKPYFRADSEKGELGSPPLMEVLHNLKPQWWFSAHLHVRFEAEVLHGPALPPQSVPSPAPVANPDEIAIDDLDIEESDEPPKADDSATTVPANNANMAAPLNPDEIALDDEEEDVASPPAPPPPPSRTRFLALDKCLPKREFLEIVDVPVPEGQSTDGLVFTFDPEWLAIQRAMHPLLSTTNVQPAFPSPEEAWNRVNEEFAWVQANVPKLFKDPKQWRIEEIQRFEPSAPGGDLLTGPKGQQPPFYLNQQTVAFTEMLQVGNKIVR